MSVETELEAIRTGAAIFPLTDRAFLRITGSDATRWLNGMVTNSIQSLQPGEGNYNFLLNAQGRIQGDCTIYRTLAGDPIEYILETTEAQIDSVEQLLDKFIIMDDVLLEKGLYIEGLRLPNDSLSRQGIGLLGLNAQNMLAAESTEFRQIESAPGRMLVSFENGSSMSIFTPAQSSTPSYEIWTSSPLGATLLRERLIGSGAIEISPETLEAHRILSATPKYSQDIRNTETNKDLPQETAQTHALHFNKGCYLGQEIVERIRSRGQVHRTFTAFTLTGELPSLPAPLEAAIAGQTRPAGELTSAMRIGDTIHALGYLRREFATHPLTYSGGTATPKNPSL
jgi:folate-binding protein YgfZ